MGKRIVVKGQVHDVGYRPFLLGIAGSLKIENFFADNFLEEGEQALEVLVDGEDEKIDLFSQTVKNKYPENAVVDELRAEDYSGSVMDVESYYRYLTATQLSKMATYGGKMLDKQDLMVDKQDILIGKQDETISTIRDESQKTRDTVREESHKTRDDLKDTLERGFDGLRQQVEAKDI